MREHNCAHWRQLREQVIARSGGVCERCRAREGQLLHHLNYECLGEETLADVKLFCASCHKLEHLARPDLAAPRQALLQRPKPGRRKRWRAIIKVVRMGTVCERCGDPARTIEWHHEDHPQHPERRIGNMIDHHTESLEEIIHEIERCEAVCRRCHMRDDGRTGKLRQNTHSRGEHNPRARLTVALVEEIRATYASDPAFGRQAALARQYGIPAATINHVIHGRTWTSD